MLIFIFTVLWWLISFQLTTHIPNAGIALSIAFWTIVILSVLCILRPRWWSHALCLATALSALIGVLVLMDNSDPPKVTGLEALTAVGQFSLYLYLLGIFGILLLADLMIWIANLCRTPAKGTNDI